MRGVRLDDLVDRLRAEVGHSTNPAVGVSAKDYLVQVLRRTQDRLWEEYDWSHLKVSRDLPVASGQRYYSVPDDLPYERIITASFKYGDDWHELCHNIDETHYSTYDSDRDIRSWPVMRWDVAEDTGVVDEIGVIELWPVPSRGVSTTDGQVRLTGIRTIAPMVGGGDKCELDGTLLVLMAAAEIQARQNQADAQIKLTQATQLLSRLMNQTTNKTKVTEFNSRDQMCDGFRPREITSVTSLGGGGGGGTPGPVPTDVYIPLSGTEPLKPVTGPIQFQNSLGNIVYTMGTDVNGRPETFGFTTALNGTSFVIATKSGLNGTVNGFTFNDTGQITTPGGAGNNDEFWRIGSLNLETIGGPVDLFTIAPINGVGQNRSAPIALVSAENTGWIFHVDGHVQAPRATSAVDPALALVTKGWVETLIPPGGGEANTASSPGTEGFALTLPKAGADLPFKRLLPGAGFEFTEGEDGLTIGASAPGGFLNTDGSNWFVGPAPLEIRDASKVRWFEDTGVTPRIEAFASAGETPGRQRAAIRFFDVDGNDGIGEGVDENQEIISIRTETIGGQTNSGIVMQRNIGTSTSDANFTGVMGFNNFKTADDVGQFLFQGTTAEYPDIANRRRAWFGTNFFAGANPGATGLSNIQLYIDRPTPGTTGFIDLAVDGSDRFTVTKEGGVSAAGSIVAKGLHNAAGQIPGFGVTIEADQTGLQGAIKSYNGSTKKFHKLFIGGDEIDFRTSDSTGAEASLRSNMKIWQNPATPTTDEVAIFNKAQFVIYKDQVGSLSQRVIDTYGTGSASNGFRVHSPLHGVAGTLIESWSNGTNRILMNRTNNTGVCFSVTSGTDAGPGNPTEMVVEGNIRHSGLISDGSWIFQNGGGIYGLREPTTSSEAATKNYVDTRGFALLSNTVTLNTNQTITGFKSFSNTISSTGIRMAGAIDMQQNVIYSVPTPLGSTWAVPQSYVANIVNQVAVLMGASPSVMLQVRALMASNLDGTP
jgi:hypothetical protein